VPKLFLKAKPGAILTNDTLVNLVRGWPALTEKTVAGIHFVQEDSPDEIGRPSQTGWVRRADGGDGGDKGIAYLSPSPYEQIFFASTRRRGLPKQPGRHQPIFGRRIISGA
jgi:hypothetical protein